MPGRILVKTLDGRWENLGTDRDPGNMPYGIAPTWNAMGPDTLAFNIRRDPALEHDDLAAFAPIRYYPDALDRPTWAGFLLERPGTDESDPSIAGAGRGWQYHLDDDLYKRLLVHSDLTAWVDARTLQAGAFNQVHLSKFVSQHQVNVGNGGITLAMPKGLPVDPNDLVGVIFDAGPDPTCWPSHYDLVITATAGVPAANFNVYVRCSDSVEAFVATGVTGTDKHDALGGATTGTSWGGTLDPAGTNGRRRYTAVFFARAAGAPVVAVSGSTNSITIETLNLYGAAAYRNAGPPGRSTLKVSQIIANALPLAPLLDQATDLITDTLLEISHAAWPTENKTPREVLAGWNAYHQYVLRLGGPNLSKIEFKPQPARATLRVDTGKPGARFADASTASGADVYNRVLVHARSGAGVDLEVERLASNLPGYPRALAVGLQPLNPSADVDALNTTGTVRDTAVFETTPASFGNAGGTGDVMSWAFPAGGTFRRGVTYVLELSAKGNIAMASRTVALGVTPGSAGGDYAVATVNFTTAFQRFIVAWTPQADYASNLVTAVTSKLSKVGGSPAHNVDSLAVTIGAASIVDRRGFRRAKVLEVGSPSDPVAMAALGDAWLALHRATALKGSLTISSDTAVTELVSGRAIPADELGLYMGELIHLANLVDPDTGEQGRNGRIAAASGSGTVTLTLDNERTAFDALLARMAVVQTRK